MAFSLTIEEGPGAGRSLRFDQPEVSFGRTADNDVVLYDPDVSRHHFSIVQEGGAFVLHDLASSNGTRVNGAKVSEHALSPGDRIEVGEAIFVFQAYGAAASIARRPRSARPAAPSPGPPPRVALRGPADAAFPGEPAGEAPSAAVPARRGAAGRVARPDPYAGMSARERFRARKAAETPIGRLKLWYGRLPEQKQKMVLGGGGVLLLLALLLVLKSSMGGNVPLIGSYDYGNDKLELTGPVTTAAFGYGVQGVERAKDHIVFRFRYLDGRATLYYDAGWIDSDQEVEIRLNDERIVGYAPVSIKTWTDGNEIVLPHEGLLPNAFNTITFDNTKNPATSPPETWAIKDVRVVEEPLPEADPTVALERFQLGEKRFAERQIGPENLYEACKFFREARDYLERLTVKPPLYDEAGARLKECNVELKRAFDRLRFTAAKYEKFRKWDEAKATYQQMLEYFPDENDRRHQQIEAWLDRFQ